MAAHTVPSRCQGRYGRNNYSATIQPQTSKRKQTTKPNKRECIFRFTVYTVYSLHYMIYVTFESQKPAELSYHFNSHRIHVW